MCAKSIDVIINTCGSEWPVESLV